MTLPVARALGRVTGKPGSLRVRVACPVCHAGPSEECDDDAHDEEESAARHSHDFMALFGLIRYRSTPRVHVVPFGDPLPWFLW